MCELSHDVKSNLFNIIINDTLLEYNRRERSPYTQRCGYLTAGSWAPAEWSKGYKWRVDGDYNTGYLGYSRC